MQANVARLKFKFLCVCNIQVAKKLKAEGGARPGQRESGETHEIEM